MIKKIRRAGTNECGLGRDSANVREQIADPHSRGAILAKGALGTEQGGTLLERRVHEGKAFALKERIGNWSSIQLIQFRLVVKEFQL